MQIASKKLNKNSILNAPLKNIQNAAFIPSLIFRTCLVYHSFRKSQEYFFDNFRPIKNLCKLNQIFLLEFDAIL